jgi:hypothetical protein
VLRHTERINVAISCGPFLPLGAFVEFSTLSWVVERWSCSSMSLLLSTFLKSIGENRVTMIIWFLNLRHSGNLFGVCFLISAQQIFLFSSYPLKAKYVELMGKEKGYNSSHAYCQVKGWSKKSYETFSNDFGKGFEICMMEGEKMDSRKKILKLKCFSPPKIMTSSFYLQRLLVLFFSLPLFSIIFSISFFQCFVSLRTWGFR